MIHTYNPKNSDNSYVFIYTATMPYLGMQLEGVLSTHVA